jgi:glycosyltransferase involved in cell wall biosynthesis
MISVCILTKNGAETLAATLDSVKQFPEVILLDNGSTDQTLAIASRYPNVKIFESPFIGFGPLRNKAAELASYDWILALDSDEVVKEPEKILKLKLEKAAYKLPRHNYYNGKRIRGCGWGNEWVARLYHREKGRFSEAQVHESLSAEEIEKLPSPLLHTPYRSTADFLHKMQHYSTLFAQQHKGKKSSFGKACGHGIFAFFKSYLLKGGIFCGKEGFIISLYNANTAFYKYLKLRDLNRLTF